MILFYCNTAWQPLTDDSSDEDFSESDDDFEDGDHIAELQVITTSIVSFVGHMPVKVY